MQDLNIIKIIKKIFLNKSFIYVFFVSFISLIIILAVGLGFVWRYRANVFDYFAKEYLQELQNPNNSLGSGGKLTAEKIAEKQLDTFLVAHIIRRKSDSTCVCNISFVV